MRAPLDEQELETLRSELEGESDDDELGVAAVPGSFPEPRAQSGSAYY